MIQHTPIYSYKINLQEPQPKAPQDWSIKRNREQTGCEQHVTCIS